MEQQISGTKRFVRRLPLIRSLNQVRVAMLRKWRAGLPKEYAHKQYYKKIMKKPLDLQNPKDMNEKLQWLMVYRYQDDYGIYADKYRVREYVSQKGYADCLPTLYGAYDRAEQLDFSRFPNAFVLKANHGSGPDYYVICRDKAHFSEDEARSKMARALKLDFSEQQLEYHYKAIKPKIICEEFLAEDSDMPVDYKVYCFGGKAESILLCLDRQGYDVKLMIKDKDWNTRPFIRPEYQYNGDIPKPETLESMLRIAEDLAKPFVFARIDFYSIHGRLVFGEITLTPAAGVIQYKTQEALDYYGALMDLDYQPAQA